MCEALFLRSFHDFFLEKYYSKYPQETIFKNIKYLYPIIIISATKIAIIFSEAINIYSLFNMVHCRWHQTASFNIVGIICWMISLNNWCHVPYYKHFNLVRIMIKLFDIQVVQVYSNIICNGHVLTFYHYGFNYMHEKRYPQICFLFNFTGS